MSSTRLRHRDGDLSTRVFGRFPASVGKMLENFEHVRSSNDLPGSATRRQEVEARWQFLVSCRGC